MGNAALTRDETGEVISADIEIYEGRIKKFKDVLSSYVDAGKEEDLDTKQKLYAKVDHDSAVAANIGHEVEHAADKENQDIPVSDPASEIVPSQIEIEILKESIK
jgi:hypothetical protein